MPKMPAGTEQYQRRLRESKQIVDRLRAGHSMLVKDIQNGQISHAEEVIRQYEKLSHELLGKMEEMAVIHQFLALGQSTVIRRNGTMVQTDQLMGEDNLEMDGSAILLLSHLKNIFGDIPHDILRITD